MASFTLLLSSALIALPAIITAAPVNTCLSDPSCGPIPGQSILYNTYNATTAPWPGNTTGAILNTTTGPAGADDLLFQNLLSAEWIIFSFYQQGVEAFNSTSFTAANFPNTTYERLLEIRNNEAGHLRIFQNQITSNTIKPGPCKYHFPFVDPTSFLALQTVIEVSSMAFLTGLELQARLNTSRSALVAIAATESRHNTWSLINNWGVSPFAGPADTVYPYANQILDFTNEWVVPGSCPSENPIYPSPRPNLPVFSLNPNTTRSLAPGAQIDLVFSNATAAPNFSRDTQYYAVFFHGVSNISVPLNTTTLSTTVPPQLDPTGIYELVIADREGAPTEDSVVAGPVVLLEEPAPVGLSLEKQG